MSISEKQQELDIIKWEKSVELGKDACGSFDYCKHCNKNEENPCAKAYNSLHTVTDVVELESSKQVIKRSSTPKKPAPAKKATPTKKSAPAKKATKKAKTSK